MSKNEEMNDPQYEFATSVPYIQKPTPSMKNLPQVTHEQKHLSGMNDQRMTVQAYNPATAIAKELRTILQKLPALKKEALSIVQKIKQERVLTANDKRKLKKIIGEMEQEKFISFPLRTIADLEEGTNINTILASLPTLESSLMGGKRKSRKAKKSSRKAKRSSRKSKKSRKAKRSRRSSRKN